MNPDALQSAAPGRVHRVGTGEAAYWAYYPAPLPPAIDFDFDLIKLLSAADHALGELAGLGRGIPNPHLLIRPFVRREAVLSSRIEGTQADVADLYAYEAGQLPLPGLREQTAQEQDVREVLNYVHALEYGLERMDTLPMSLRLLRELHERLMDGVRGEYATPGEFRRTQNWIGPPGCTLNSATYVPPPVEEMMDALTALETYIHADALYPPLVRIALLHYQFEAIHPFLDGNGRIGRLLITLLLVHWSLLPLPLLYLSAYFEQSRDRYYDLLLRVSTHGDWRAWLAYFLTGVERQAQDAIARGRALMDLQADWRIELQKAGVSGALPALADYLFERPILSGKQVAARLDVSHQTAMQSLRRLEELGMVQEVTGRRRNQQFAALQILAITE